MEKTDEAPVKTVTECFSEACKEFTDIQCESLAPFVPFFFYKGKAMSFKDHFPMKPFFKLKRPRRVIYMCGRQLGKSVSQGIRSILQSRIIGNYDILFVQPRFEQVKRFSTEYVDSFLVDTPISSFLMDKKREKGIMKKPIGGGGTLHFSYAFLTPDACRGFAVQELILDELQDLNNDFLPILEEVLSAQTEHGFRVYSGTPKTEENTMAVQFSRSSQAFVHIKCEHCDYENIANKDNHIYKMIGKEGCICAKCGKLLNLRRMRFVHHYRDRRSVFEGYHIPQIIHPLHAFYPEKWSELLAKMEIYPEALFENEILGLPSAHNTVPITEAELRDACDPEIHNDLRSAIDACRKSTMSVMGVDWSGFGDDMTSTTVVTIATSVPGSDALKIVYMERLKMGADAEEESRYLRTIFVSSGANFFAHDFSGAGTIREALMAQMGMNKKKIIPYDIVHAPVRKKIIAYYKPSDGSRSCYNIDKTRSLMILYEMIKKKKVIFPNWEECSDVLRDFLNISRESKSTPRGGDFIIMDRMHGKTDDAVHSVNFACSTIWHSSGKYPKLAFSIPNKDLEETLGDLEEQGKVKSRVKNLNLPSSY